MEWNVDKPIIDFSMSIKQTMKIWQNRANFSLSINTADQDLMPINEHPNFHMMNYPPMQIS